MKNGILCFGFGVTLREGNREYFYECLDKHFPNLKEVYIKEFGEQYEINSPNNKELWSIFKDFCQQNNIMYNADEIFKYLKTLDINKGYEQISLF